MVTFTKSNIHLCDIILLYSISAARNIYTELQWPLEVINVNKILGKKDQEAVILDKPTSSIEIAFDEIMIMCITLCFQYKLDHIRGSACSCCWPGWCWKVITDLSHAWWNGEVGGDCNSKSKSFFPFLVCSLLHNTVRLKVNIPLSSVLCRCDIQFSV